MILKIEDITFNFSMMSSNLLESILLDDKSIFVIEELFFKAWVREIAQVD
jgi:hypothetical protein